MKKGVRPESAMGGAPSAPSERQTDAWLLDLAADELLSRGWRRYNLADDTGMCAVGAIVCAATGDEAGLALRGHLDVDGPMERRLNRLARAMGFGGAWLSCCAAGSTSLVAWNNKQAADRDEVVARFRAGAEALRLSDGDFATIGNSGRPSNPPRRKP